MFRTIFLNSFFLMLMQVNATAQNSLTGTWQGNMGEEMLQINVLEKNNKICGYTYDYFKTDLQNYCKALFEVRYNKEQEIWYLNGNAFLENSGGHVLMRIRLWFPDGEGTNTIHALVSTKGSLFSLLGSAQEVILKRVSKIPNNVNAIKAACFPEEIKTPVQTKPPVEFKKPIPPVTKPQQKPATPGVDSLNKALPVKPPVVTKPVIFKKDSLLNSITTRRKNAFAHLVVDVKNITLNIYDNGIVDGDSISIYYNAKLIAHQQRISEKAITLKIELDEAKTIHEITLYAENLGSIPPNTALVVVTAGDKRYELHSSASLTENAVLFLEYKPKKND